jgi:hypothetical protein
MAREVREARAHVVSIEGETPDADVSPESGTLFRLAGLVLCDREGPVTVTLSSETGRRRTETACRAGYQFQGLAPGAYEIFATMRDTASSGFTEIFLDRDSDAGNVQLMTSPMVNFTVRMAGSKDGADVSAKVPVTITGRRQDMAESEEEREFNSGRSVPLASGHWEFRAKAPPGYYVESITQLYGFAGSRRMYKPERVGDWFEVYIEARYSQTIRVAVSDRAGQMMGRVMAEGKPVAGAPVYLWPAAEAARRSLGGAQQLIADAGGRFRFDGLPPGDYRVVASFDLSEIDEEAAEECRAQTVRVEERQTAAIDLGVWTAP